MPRFITVQLQCDWTDCTTVADEGSDEVIERTITLDRGKPRKVLVCKQHNTDLDDLLLPLMQRGTTVEPAGKRPKGGGATAPSQPTPVPAAGGGQKAENVECKVDGCDRTLHNRTGMAQHVIRTHGYESLAAYELEFGPISGTD